MRDTVCGHVAKEVKLGFVLLHRKPKGCFRNRIRKALVQPYQFVLLNVDRWTVSVIARGGHMSAVSLLGAVFLNVTQHTSSISLRNEVATADSDLKGSRMSENEVAPRSEGVSLYLQ